jgi:predicted CoA-substrate-specific enzyme activase
MVCPGAEAAEKALDELFRRVGGKRGKEFFIVSTGMGMHRVPSANLRKSEVICLARGSRAYDENAYTLVDIGAETTKAIRLNPEGKVIEYIKNNKCAAGTAMLLKVMSEILDIPVSKMDQVPFLSDQKIKLSNVCSVFVESETISYLSRGISRERILAGAHEAIVDQLMALLERIEVKRDLVLTGGTARNRTLSGILSHRLGFSVSVPPEPEMIAAMGASLLGQDYHKGS